LDIIRHDEALLDIFGTQLYELTLTTIFGEQFASYITDILDGSAEALLDILSNLLDGRADNIIDLLIGYIGDRLFDGLGALLGSEFLDNITGQLRDILNDILENVLLDNPGNLLGGLGDLFNNSFNGNIPDWLSGLFGSPADDN
jgi:hypothetical protein